MAVVVVTGSRYYSDFDTINKEIESITPIIENKKYFLLHGGCTGADQLAGNYASGKTHISVIECKADWERYGKSAGPRRNAEMMEMAKSLSVQYSLPVKVLAFHFEDQYSKSGTENAVMTASRMFQGHTQSFLLEVVLNGVSTTQRYYYTI